MRRVLATILPLSLLAFAIACDDTTFGGGPDLDLDAGNLDATIPPIPQVDASTPDAAIITVTVQVLGGAAKVGVPVVFEYADAKLESITTDANGLATSAGATTPVKATALLTYANNGAAPVTWLGIGAGDVLQVRAFDPDANLLGFYNLTAADPMGDEVDAYVSDACPGGGFDGVAGGVAVYGHCAQDDGKATILARRKGNGDATFAFLKDVPGPAAAGTALTLGAWTTADKYAVVLQNLPTSAGLVVRTNEVYKGRAFYRDGRNLEGGDRTEFVVPAGFATSHQVGVSLDGNGGSLRGLITSAAPDATKTVTLDLAKLPSELGPISVEGEPKAAKFGWTGDTAAMTGGIVSVTYPSNGFGPKMFWTFVVPAGTASVTLPSLPADRAAFAVRDDATIEEDFDLNDDSLAFVKAPAALTPALLRAKAALLGDITLLYATQLVEQAALPVDGEYALTGRLPLRRGFRRSLD